MHREPSAVGVLEDTFRSVFFSSRPQIEADALAMHMQLKQLVEQLVQHGCELPSFNLEPNFQSIADNPCPVHTMKQAIQQAYKPVYDALSAKMVQQGQKEFHNSAFGGPLAPLFYLQVCLRIMRRFVKSPSETCR